MGAFMIVENRKMKFSAWNHMLNLSMSSPQALSRHKKDLGIGKVWMFAIIWICRLNLCLEVTKIHICHYVWLTDIDEKFLELWHDAWQWLRTWTWWLRYVLDYISLYDIKFGFDLMVMIRFEYWWFSLMKMIYENNDLYVYSKMIWY